MKKIPDHLNHTPIVKLENYRTIDGKYSNNTDAMGFSIGLAQWDQSENRKEISAKVFRYNDQWSPQSEELPLHRVLDLANFICSTIFQKNSGSFIDVKGLEPEMSNDDELKKILKDWLNDEVNEMELRKSLDNLTLTILKIVEENLKQKYKDN